MASSSIVRTLGTTVYQMISRMIREIIKLPGIVILGAGIMGCNLVNIPRSPIYNRQQPVLSCLKLGTISVLKAGVYTTFYPFTLFRIIYDLVLKKEEVEFTEFKMHLIPASRYFHPQ